MAESENWTKATVTKEEIRELDSSRMKLRLYADENIEEEAVDYLRGEGINVVTAKELGHEGKPDCFVAAYAKRNKRFVLTKNGKDFLDDRKLPFHHTYGIIAIEADPRNRYEYISAYYRVTMLATYAREYIGHKITIHAKEVKMRFIGRGSGISVLRFQFRRDGIYLTLREGVPDAS